MPTEPQQLAAEDNIRCAMRNQMRPIALEPGAGTTVLNPVGGRLVFKLRGEQSNGAMTAGLLCPFAFEHTDSSSAISTRRPTKLALIS